jgi:hypothetical protein
MTLTSARWHSSVKAAQQVSRLLQSVYMWYVLTPVSPAQYAAYCCDSSSPAAVLQHNVVPSYIGLCCTDNSCACLMCIRMCGCVFAGALDAVVSGLLTPVRRERLKMHPVDIPEILHWLCRVRGCGCC